MQGDAAKAWTARTKRAMKAVLDQAMEAQRLTAPMLADKLRTFDDDIDANKIRKWRSGTTLPPPHLAQPLARELGLTDARSDPEIVEALGFDPMVMVRLYGLVPREEHADRLLCQSSRWDNETQERDLIERLRILESLELELAESAQLLAEFEHNQAASIVLNGVEESRAYGVAFWPVHAGPSEQPEHQLHVSDRVDLRRLDGKPTDENETWENLGTTLARARALPSSAEPRWARVEGALPVPDPHVSRWNLRRLDVPRRARIPHAHPGLPALSFTATVSSSWVGNLASLVSLVLGYAVTSTTDLARPLTGNAHYIPNTAQRSGVHSELLRDPGDRRIWYHAAKSHPDHAKAPWKPTTGRAHPDLVHVRLCESDELLEATAEDRKSIPGFTPSVLSAWKKARDYAIDTVPQSERVLLLHVDHVPWASTEKWLSTFGRAREVMQFIADLKIEPWAGLARSQQSWAEHDLELTRPAFTWLREASTPFVHAPGDVKACADFALPPVSRINTQGSGTPHQAPLPEETFI